MLDWLKDEKNRAVIGWVGGGLSVAVAAIWTAYLHFFPTPEPKKQAPGQVQADCGSVAVGGDVSGTTINAGNSGDCLKPTPTAKP